MYNIIIEVIMEIIYKQDALQELSKILKKNYFAKKILILMSNTIKEKAMSIFINEINSAGNPFNINEKKGEYDLVVSVGGGKICNEAKIYALVKNIDLIVVPTSPTSPIFFNDICFDQSNFELHKGKEPNYVLVDEKIIQNAPLYLAKRGFLLGLAYNEILYEKEIYSLLYKADETMEDLRYLLINLENCAEKLASGERESRLEVMDFMIEIAKLKLDFSAIFTLSHLLEISDNFADENIVIRKYKKISNLNKNLNLNYLIASDLLICCFKEMFSLKKIEPKLLPSIQKLDKKLKNFNILDKKLKNFAFFDEIIENKEFFLKINVIKHRCYYLAEIYKSKIKSNIKKIINISPEIPDIDVCFNAISVVPIFDNKNTLINLLSCVGIIE